MKAGAYENKVRPSLVFRAAEVFFRAVEVYFPKSGPVFASRMPEKIRNLRPMWGKIFNFVGQCSCILFLYLWAPWIGRPSNNPTYDAAKPH